ncbi:MAG TPA: cobyric acid synthase, partial [bacterium]|nr:cobyric acid synthase [bacterium]
MPARSIMIQGTGSHVGKSLITAGLCRLLYQDGFRVSPFKSQNMSNNSYVTADEKEMGRAQAVQAEAAGVLPVTDMNPILLKPASDTGAQVILNGRPYRIMGAQDYQFHTLNLFQHVRDAFERLKKEFNAIVIEGAGSPAEINLQAFDIANMRVAEMAEAPVLLVGDIDRGGVFASLIGTLDLLPLQHRGRVKGFLINKFRGDIKLLEPGLEELRQRTGIPVLGVLPYLHDLELLEEDGLSDARIAKNRVCNDPEKIQVDVIWLPHISNVTDFAAFDTQPDASLTYLRQIPQRLPDVLILPGTKSTMTDLEYLYDSGFAR